MSIASALGISEEQFLNSIIPEERIKNIGPKVDFITSEMMATIDDEIHIFYPKKDKICKNCKWYAIFEGVCCNGESEYRADFTDSEFSCEKFDMATKERKSEICPMCGGEVDLHIGNLKDLTDCTVSCRNCHDVRHFETHEQAMRYLQKIK